MGKAMKVIHMIGGGEFGGAENHILQLLQTFSNEKVQAKVICFYDSAFATHLRKRGIEVLVIDRYHRFDPRMVYELGRILRDERPDILHTHGVKANFFGRLVSQRLRGMKVVTTVHSLLRYDYSGWLFKLLTNAMERTTRRFTDRFICVSQEIKQDIVQTGVPAARIAVVPNGIEIDRFVAPSQPISLKEQLKLSSSTFLIGTAARLRPVKGTHLLIEAVGQLHQKGFDVQAAIIGEGPERQALEQQVERLHLQDAVHFLGFQNEVERYLPSFDCFANVSLSEGLPVAVLEAMAAKVPVLATNVGAVPEVITDGEEGLVVEKNSPNAIAEGLARLIRDRSLGETFVEKAYQKVIEQYTTQVMSDRNIAIYHALLEDDNH